MRSSFDWETFRASWQPVPCRVTPRPQHAESLSSIAGRVLMLVPAWQMGAEDPFPGEWVLVDPFSVRGLSAATGARWPWLASGDIIVEAHLLGNPAI